MLSGDSTGVSELDLHGRSFRMIGAEPVGFVVAVSQYNPVISAGREGPVFRIAGIEGNRKPYLSGSIVFTASYAGEITLSPDRLVGLVLLRFDPEIVAEKNLPVFHVPDNDVGVLHLLRRIRVQAHIGNVEE